MGDRHGGCFARRGRTLNPSRPQVDAHRGVGLPTRRTSEKICPAQERSPRRRLPDTAHERKDLPRARTLSSAKVSRHGARAKGFARAGTLSSAKAFRHGARAKGFAHTRTLSSAKASRHGARAKRFAPRGSRSPHVPTNGGPPSTDGQPEKHPFGGVAPTACGRCRVHSPKKIRLLHETQLFYGESHVGSRPIFPSFPSVGRCVARERNPVPPFAPHCGRGHRGLRRTGEMCHGFGEMVRRFGECPRGGESLPRGGNGWPLGGGRHSPGLRGFGERFHRRRRANPDACRGRRCSRAHDDLGQRAFRCSRPTFRHRRRSGEKNFDDDGYPLGRTAGSGGGSGRGAALGRRPHGALHAVARPASADGARAREATHVLRRRTRRRLPNGGAAPARTPR